MTFNPNKARLFEGSFFWIFSQIDPQPQPSHLQLLKNILRVCWTWKNTDIICYKLTSLVSLSQRNVKKSKKLIKSMKLANFVKESLHIFWTTCGISMKFSGMMWLMIILKVTKNQEFTIALLDTSLKKPQEGSNCPPAFLGLRIFPWPCD